MKGCFPRIGVFITWSLDENDYQGILLRMVLRQSFSNRSRKSLCVLLYSLKNVVGQLSRNYSKENHQPNTFLRFLKLRLHFSSWANVDAFVVRFRDLPSHVPRYCVDKLNFGYLIFRSRSSSPDLVIIRGSRLAQTYLDHMTTVPNIAPLPHIAPLPYSL